MKKQDAFTDYITDRAKSNIKHIVLPEGDDPRMIEAAAYVSTNKIAKLTILGNVDKIVSDLADAGADMSSITVVCPEMSDKYQDYAEQFYELRKNKGVDMEKALGIMKDVMYFGTMMIKVGDADGMVAGACHSSADTIRPSLQIVKCAPGVKTVSSMFFMCKGDNTYLYSDCGLNQDPTPEQLADITISTAKTAEQFGILPKIALLSYSSKGSGIGPNVEKMQKAFELASDKMEKEFNGDYIIDGELQFDAAFVPSVAASKTPDSPLKGEANTFIFPDLGAGNIAYKLSERMAEMSAFGPILQGIAKPVNDLSRGCSSDDIIATVAITAIQAS